jgi:hypothetical protein
MTFCPLENAADEFKKLIVLDFDNFTSALASSKGSLEKCIALSSAAFSEAEENRSNR